MNQSNAAGLSLASMWVGFIAFVVAALLGFYQVIERIDLIPALKSPELYFGSVSTHGVLMAFVLTTFLVMGYGYYTATTSLKQDLWNKPLAWFGFWLAVVGVLLAAGSLVAPGKELYGGWLWAGRPAKPVRELRPEELEFFVHSAAHYAELKDQYRNGA